MVKRGKPAPDLFLMAAERLGAAPKDCVVIEDSPAGIRAARAAGHPDVLAPPTFAPRLTLEAAAVVTTPVVPHDYVDMVAPLQSRVSLMARVERVRRESDRTVSLWLRPGVLWRSHRPGQYIRIGVDVDGVRHWRTYSLTSKPAPSGTRATPADTHASPRPTAAATSRG